MANYPLLVLDGAFGTELARRGFDTNDALWSAKALFEKPELVEAVHRDYYEAGADVSTSASYQATIEGFEKKGFSRDQAKELITAVSVLVFFQLVQFAAIAVLANLFGDGFTAWSSLTGVQAGNAIFAVALVCELIVCVIFYLVTYFFLTRKLNLE